MNRHAKISGTIAFVLALLLLPAAMPTQAQTSNTVGLLEYDPDRTMEGYTLYAPMRTKNTYLIDMYGRIVHSWATSHSPGAGVYLLDNGDLLMTCRANEEDSLSRTQRYDWDNNLVWVFSYTDSLFTTHHDLEPLPNGNVLVLGWDQYTKDEAIQAGRDSAVIGDGGLTPERILEVQPIGADSGVIVWEWRVFDHLIQDFDSTKDNYGVVEDHYELLDINFPPTNSIPDWQHANAIDYNPDLDQIVMSSRSMNEIYIIDHSTTTAEAAGHSGGNSGKGGDFLYRYGNPLAYRAGTVDDQVLFRQHDSRWIEAGRPGAGNIMVYNNGSNRPEGLYSSIDVIVTPVDGQGRYPNLFPGVPFGPFGLNWEYTGDPPEDFFSPFISGAERAVNGNTVICEGRDGHLFEVTSEGDVVWSYRNAAGKNGIAAQGEQPSAHIVFRCTRLAADHPGLVGKDLTPGAPLEIYPITISGTQHTPLQPTHADAVIVTSKVYSDAVISLVEVLFDTGDGYASLPMYDDGLHQDGAAGDSIYAAELPPTWPDTEVSYYIHTSTDLDSVVIDPVIAPAVAYTYLVTLGDYVCGDADGAGEVNVSDAVYVINYIFAGGPAPLPLEAGDADCDGSVNVSDAVYLINYIFNGGPVPCAEC